MNLLIAGLAVFVLIHLVPSFPGFREGLISRVGGGAYKGIFSVLSILGIVLIVFGLKTADTVPWYDPPAWARGITYLLVFIALYLFASNPLGSAPSTAKYLTAHPLSWGLIFWSFGHLLSNGDKAHVILFGVFLAFGIVSIYSGNRRGQKPVLDKRPALAAELIFLVVVAAIYVGLFWGHRYFTGMPLV